MEKHSTVIDGRRHMWHTERLWELAADLPRFQVEIESFSELDQDCWFGTTTPTIREVADHCRRINRVDVEAPEIINANGRLMDGGHRIARALLDGRTTVPAVQFAEMPTPDAIEDVE